MCIASLHASTQPCAHRWYQLVRSCKSDTDLHNCPNKLRLEGWENRADACPWCDCDIATPRDGSYRLFGSPVTGTSTPATSASELGTTPPQRVDSWGTLSSMSTLSRHASISSIESESAQRHREMNERVQVYLTARPDEILPSASRNYPTYPQRQDSIETREAQVRRLFSVQTKDAVTRHIRKGVRLSLDILRP